MPGPLSDDLLLDRNGDPLDVLLGHSPELWMKSGRATTTIGNKNSRSVRLGLHAEESARSLTKSPARMSLQMEISTAM
jgi:hypothetical protein